MKGIKEVAYLYPARQIYEYESSDRPVTGHKPGELIEIDIIDSLVRDVQRFHNNIYGAEYLYYWLVIGGDISPPAKSSAPKEVVCSPKMRNSMSLKYFFSATEQGGDPYMWQLLILVAPCRGLALTSTCNLSLAHERAVQSTPGRGTIKDLDQSADLLSIGGKIMGPRGEKSNRKIFYLLPTTATSPTLLRPLGTGPSIGDARHLRSSLIMLDVTT
ncbi:hypothetical protein GGX14DRAFT_402206 [Mycena pura]|uniref:Uncharacterized protein n=1 Tax=Mycena pura TaxID=153505 RepID=A0AAD6UYT0_9AGAR|nr:hypothetical protein GGX14DRAFT_402206 [Mycena pura]